MLVSFVMSDTFRFRGRSARSFARKLYAKWPIVAILCGLALARPVWPATLEEAVEESKAGNQAAAEAQARIDELGDDIDRLAAEYRRALEEERSLEAYSRQLDELLASQDRELSSLRKQIDEVSVVSRQIMPLMERMIEALEQFVKLDKPFLSEEREKRIAGLRELLGRADVTMSEKYRRLMEAYQVENEYGRTIEAYRGSLAKDGANRTVDFLRIGRVALLYQTLDASETGFWNPDRGGWETLSDEYRSPVRQGLRVARKQVSPELIRVPVAAPVEAR